jgi:hypothetical protein
VTERPNTTVTPKMPQLSIQGIDALFDVWKFTEASTPEGGTRRCGGGGRYARKHPRRIADKLIATVTPNDLQMLAVERLGRLIDTVRGAV